MKKPLINGKEFTLRIFRLFIINVPILERLLYHLGTTGISKLNLVHRDLLRYDDLPKGSAQYVLLHRYMTEVFQEFIKFRRGKAIIVLGNYEYRNDVTIVNWGMAPPPDHSIPKLTPFSRRITQKYRTSHLQNPPYQVYLARAVENPYQQIIDLEFIRGGYLCHMELTPKQIKRYTHDPNYQLPFHKGMGIIFFPTEAKENPPNSHQKHFGTIKF